MDTKTSHNTQQLWLCLAILGTVIPNIFFMGQYIQYGFNPAVGWQLATHNWISQGVTTDLLLASLFFWIWGGLELRRQDKLGQIWIYVLLALCLGLSCAIPVFMYRHGREVEPGAWA